jgi:Signal transduction histidine kinase
MFQSINDFTLPARGFPQAHSEEETHPEPNFEKFLLTVAAHDLWHPLQTVGRSLERVSEGIRSIEDIDLLQRGEDALGRIIEDLSLLIEALPNPQEQGGVLRPVMVRSLLAQTVQDCEDMARDVGVFVRRARTSTVVVSHPLLLRTILRNLTRHAVLLAGEEGQVLLGARRRGDTARFDVVFSRPSSSEEAVLPFSPFMQPDSPQDIRSSAALYIVRHALRILGYHSEMRPVRQHGFRFSFFAPLAPDRALPQPLGFAEEEPA